MVVFTSKDGSINKAHAKHLEARLCALAGIAKRCDLDNKVPPGAPNLTDSDRDSSERFLAEMLVVLPALGITAFELPDPTLAHYHLCFSFAAAEQVTGLDLGKPHDLGIIWLASLWRNLGLDGPA